MDSRWVWIILALIILGMIAYLTHLHDKRHATDPDDEIDPDDLNWWNKYR